MADDDCSNAMIVPLVHYETDYIMTLKRNAVDDRI